MNRTPANKAGSFWALFLSLCLSLPAPALALRVQNGGLEERTKTVGELENALLRGNNPEETLASALERPKQPILQEEERERILREVWEEVVERGWLYHGTSLNNLESIRIWGLDADHKPFDTQEVDTFFRLHQKYFNLQDPYKSTRQNEIISLSYNRSLAEVFSAKPPEVIDILLRESERMIVETNPGSPSNRISDSERQWLIGLHAKYAAWAETHQPLVVAIPLKEGIERALFYRKPGDLLSNHRMSAETLYRTDPLFALLDFDVFKVMTKTRFRKFERTGFEKTALARQLQSDLRDILQDVEVSRVGGPYSGSRLSVSPSPDVFVPISEYASASAGLEELREAVVQKIWGKVHRLGTLDEIRSMPLETFARKVGVKVIDRAGPGRPIFTLTEQFYNNLLALRQTGRLPIGVAPTSYAPLADNTAIDGPGIYLATKDLEALRQALKQSGELMEYNKGTFIHELLEEAFAQAGVVDPVLHLFRQHTDPAVIEEEMLFNGLMGPQDVRQAAEIYRGMKEEVEDILLSRPQDYFPTIQTQYRALRGEIAVGQIAQSLGLQSPYYRTLGWAFETPPDRLEELAKQRWQGASFKSFVQSAGVEEKGATLERMRVRVPNLVTQQQDTVRLLRESSDQITDAAEYLPGLVVELQEAGYPEGKMFLVPGSPLAAASLDSPLVTVYVHPESEGAATAKELLDAGLGYWLRFETDPTKAQILIGDEAYKDSVASELLARKQSFLVINGNTASSVTVNLLGRLQAEGYLTAGRVFYLYTDLEDVTALFA